jgi:hypothetical protein
MVFEHHELLTFFDESHPCGDFNYGAFAFSITRNKTVFTLSFNAPAKEAEIKFESQNGHNTLAFINNIESISVNENELHIHNNHPQGPHIFTKQVNCLSCILRS